MTPVLTPTPALSLTLDEARARPIPPGRLRETVTDMEGRTPPAGPPPPLPDDLRLVRHAGTLSWEAFAPLFFAVGAPWLWRDRLYRSEAEEIAHLADPGIVIHILERAADGARLGFCEMDGRDPAAGFKVLYFGLIPEAIGGGRGRLLFAHALADAWAMGPSCIRLDTCTHDHPKAVAFYEGFGFVATGQRVTEADDPRLTGLLPRETGPTIPLAPLTERPPALRTDGRAA
ncbi:GNAT family N-acetyltransferase [Roseospira navarrensis]|uniref:GNAT family N-acetyltransferase n=1 Tax=Roseospira navarrensis TaxID=140058 RepID=A0A7X1ZCX9_9PROT|nr:GNAT family N-acetyltransferase [Roseospira navarrensis]MQX35719.1 GNAT family N-acetyltransferase [Roseospira navarrensis]